MPERGTGGRLAAAALAAVALLGLPRAAAPQPGERHGLVSISLTPAQVKRSVGDEQFYTALGRFADGSIRNVTQRVDYVSSDPKVARAPNEPGKKSRVEVVGVGQATITAVDALTGVKSAATRGDALLVAVGRMERLTIKPAQVSRALGEMQQFTVTGHYPGGATRNLTQQVRYLSSDPTVVLAPNRKGDRSRVEAVAPGTATITARDPASGLTTAEPATFTVLGKLARLTLAPARPRRAPGQIQHYTATGHYEGGTTRNLTQQVEYASSDPGVARAPNAPGERSRIEAVAPGIATITARDPASGVSSSAAGGDVLLVVYDPATGKAPGEEKLARVEGARPAAAPAAPGPFCGDASGDGAVGLADAAWIALGALGLGSCPPAACDVDVGGSVTLGDARAVFWAALGYELALTCPQ